MLCWAIKFLPGCPAKNNFSLGWLLNKWFRRLTMVFLLTWLGTDSELAEPRPPLTGNRLWLNCCYRLTLFWFPDLRLKRPYFTSEVLIVRHGLLRQLFFCLTPRFSKSLRKESKDSSTPSRTTILFQKEQKAQT